MYKHHDNNLNKLYLNKNLTARDFLIHKNLITIGSF